MTDSGVFISWASEWLNSLKRVLFLRIGLMVSCAKNRERKYITIINIIIAPIENLMRLMISDSILLTSFDTKTITFSSVIVRNKNVFSQILWEKYSGLHINSSLRISIKWNNQFLMSVPLFCITTLSRRASNIIPTSEFTVTSCGVSVHISGRPSIDDIDVHVAISIVGRASVPMTAHICTMEVHHI